MTPLERAARALCIKDDIDPDRKFKSSDYSEDTAPHEFAWQEYLPRARAVLQAMREPSNVQLGKGRKRIESHEPEGSSYQAAEGTWKDMIDAALNEEIS